MNHDIKAEIKKESDAPSGNLSVFSDARFVWTLLLQFYKRPPPKSGVLDMKKHKKSLLKFLFIYFSTYFLVALGFAYIYARYPASFSHTDVRKDHEYIKLQNNIDQIFYNGLKSVIERKNNEKRGKNECRMRVNIALITFGEDEYIRIQSEEKICRCIFKKKCDENLPRHSPDSEERGADEPDLEDYREKLEIYMGNFFYYKKGEYQEGSLFETAAQRKEAGIKTHGDLEIREGVGFTFYHRISDHEPSHKGLQTAGHGILTVNRDAACEYGVGFTSQNQADRKNNIRLSAFDAYLSHLPRVEQTLTGGTYFRSLDLSFTREERDALNTYIAYSKGAPPEKELFLRMVYFSFVTIATIGYGDIVPLSTWIRLLVLLEATIGMLYIGIFASIIFSYFIRKRADQATGDPLSDKIDRLSEKIDRLNEKIKHHDPGKES